jgi:thiamine-monophosphate kinase
MAGEGIVRLGRGVEFDRIRRILAGGEFPLSMEGVLVGPGDDGALLEGGIVLSTDLSIEGIHFRLDWVTEEEAGYRATAAGVSDLAAMGATPLGVLASVAAPGTGDGAERLMLGVRRFCADYGIPLLGGDLTRSHGPLIADIVSVGRGDRPLLRSGARESDELWVTGVLGGAAGAVALWKVGHLPPTELRAAFVSPRPRLEEARFLVEAGVHAGMDLSDGLAGDAGHMAAASGMAVVLDLSSLPTHPSLSSNALPDGVIPVDLALHGGEDYELLVAARPGVLQERVEEFRQRFDLSLTRVGRVVRGEGVFVVGATSGELLPLQSGGYDHFNVKDGAGGEA